METKQETKQVRDEDRIVRIMSEDINGNMKLYPGLTKIKGISWGFSNALCEKLKLDRHRKIGSLSEADIKKITDFVKNPDLPQHVLNRRKDFESGEDKHLVGTDLELRKDFDIKRLKKIKSLKGLRHSVGLPVRGQRTRSNFRRNRKKGTGIKKKGGKK